MYTVWGLLSSLQPPLYPREAELRGATPSEYGLVFGVGPLAGLLTSPLVAAWGGRVGPRVLYMCSSMAESVAGGVAFGMLALVADKTLFLGLSYALRFLIPLTKLRSELDKTPFS